jgi:hypothetical protein
LAGLALAKIGQLHGWHPSLVGLPGSRLVRVPAMDLVLAGAGLGIVGFGAARGSLTLALVGGPLIALGVFWALLKRSASR